MLTSQMSIVVPNGGVHMATAFLRLIITVAAVEYRSGTVNSKSFVGKVLLRIKQKFELTYAL